MNYTCFVCHKTIEPDANGEIRVEGITELPKGMAWVWGPETVHEDCRHYLKTPYDDRLGDGYKSTWQRLKA